MAEEIDLRFLGEQIKRLQGDVRQVKSDMAQADAKLEAFRETVDDRFEHQIELIKSSFGSLSQELASFRGSVGGRFETIDGRFESIDGRFEMSLPLGRYVLNTYTITGNGNEKAEAIPDRELLLGLLPISWSSRNESIQYYDPDSIVMHLGGLLCCLSSHSSENSCGVLYSSELCGRTRLYSRRNQLPLLLPSGTDSNTSASRNSSLKRLLNDSM